MQILDFILKTDLSSKNETEKAKLLCYFMYKERKKEVFSMEEIKTEFLNFGFNQPNLSRLKEHLIKGKSKGFICLKENKLLLIFIPAVLQMLERNYGEIWEDSITIVSNSELIEEVKFCGKRNYLDRLIKQINFCYGNNCFDACAVLMRRLFEVLLVMTYQYQKIDDEIKNSDGSFTMLEYIVKDAIQNKKLAIPTRISKNFESFREVGNNSAHSITYTAGKLDIDKIALNYRVMMEDLYNRAGLI